MKFPNSSYNLTMLDFSSMKGFSPREVFEKIFISTGKYSLLDYSLGEIEAKFQGISVDETYLNRHLLERIESADLQKPPPYPKLKSTSIYAPFFLSEWDGDTLFGYMVFNPKTMRYSTIVGSLTTNQWVSRPWLPKLTLEQNKNMMGRFKEGVPGGWYSDRLILFPMLPIQPTLNHPEGI